MLLYACLAVLLALPVCSLDCTVVQSTVIGNTTWTDSSNSCSNGTLGAIYNQTKPVEVPVVVGVRRFNCQNITIVETQLQNVTETITEEKLVTLENVTRECTSLREYECGIERVPCGYVVCGFLGCCTCLQYCNEVTTCTECLEFGNVTNTYSELRNVTSEVQTERLVDVTVVTEECETENIFENVTKLVVVLTPNNCWAEVYRNE